MKFGQVIQKNFLNKHKAITLCFEVHCTERKEVENFTGNVIKTIMPFLKTKTWNLSTSEIKNYSTCLKQLFLAVGKSLRKQC